jgi:hypothetical protein
MVRFDLVASARLCSCCISNSQFSVNSNVCFFLAAANNVFTQFAHHDRGVVSDTPITQKRKIGVHRIEKDTKGNRHLVQTDHSIWYTFHCKDFENTWTDEEVLAKAGPELGDVQPLRSFVFRGQRSGEWKCLVTSVFSSSEAATRAAYVLRQNKWRAGVHAPKTIVDKVIHHVGAYACTGS